MQSMKMRQKSVQASIKNNSLHRESQIGERMVDIYRRETVLI